MTRDGSGASRLIRIALCATLALAPAAPAFAQAPITVAAFLARANALKAKGMAALFSSDLRTLRDMGTAAGTDYRAQLKREQAAGKPSSCPPPKVQLDSKQFLAHLESYPEPARQRTTLTAAVGDLFARNWPCR